MRRNILELWIIDGEGCISPLLSVRSVYDSPVSLLAAVRLIRNCTFYEIRLKCRIKIILAECRTMGKPQPLHDLRCRKSLISNSCQQSFYWIINLVGALVADLIGDFQQQTFPSGCPLWFQASGRQSRSFLQPNQPDWMLRNSPSAETGWALQLEARRSVLSIFQVAWYATSCPFSHSHRRRGGWIRTHSGKQSSLSEDEVWIPCTDGKTTYSNKQKRRY